MLLLVIIIPTCAGIKPADEHEFGEDIIGVRTYTAGIDQIAEIIEEANNGGTVF